MIEVYRIGAVEVASHGAVARVNVRRRYTLEERKSIKAYTGKTKYYAKPVWFYFYNSTTWNLFSPAWQELCCTPQKPGQHSFLLEYDTETYKWKLHN